jgi:MarR family transcriptional regulator, organic hydroperoxide resistance regulator
MSAEPEEGRFELGPALSFLSAWWALNHEIEKSSKRMQVRLGVTAQQRMLVRVIGSFPGIAPGQLARVVHLDPGTISTAIGRLEEAGILERRRGTDGRSVALVLTRRGRGVDVPDAHTIEGALERSLARTPRKHAGEVRLFIERFIEELQADHSHPVPAKRSRANGKARPSHQPRARARTAAPPTRPRT